MMVHRYSTCARFLALVAALPWPAFLVNARAAARAPVGTMPVVVSAGDNAAVIAAVPADRKPIAKGERFGLDGTALTVAIRAPIVAARVATLGGEDALQGVYANHPSCAFLCRFLV